MDLKELDFDVAWIELAGHDSRHLSGSIMLYGEYAGAHEEVGVSKESKKICVCLLIVL
jgi:hypothetical protein